MFLKGILPLLKEQEKETPELGSYLIAGRDLNTDIWMSFHAYNAVRLIIFHFSWAIAGANVCWRVVIDMTVSINIMALLVKFFPWPPGTNIVTDHFHWLYCNFTTRPGESGQQSLPSLCYWEEEMMSESFAERDLLGLLFSFLVIFYWLGKMSQQGIYVFYPIFSNLCLFFSNFTVFPSFPFIGVH